MFNCIVFIPDDVLRRKGYVYGIVEEFSSDVVVYILGDKCNEDGGTAYPIIGHVDARRKYPRQKQNSWISITVNDGCVEEVHIHDRPNVEVISVVLFDKQSIQEAQLLEGVAALETDYVCRLVKEVKNEYAICKANLEDVILLDYVKLKVASHAVVNVLEFFNHPWVARCVAVTSFGMYVKNTCEMIDALLRSVLERKKLTVEFVNFLWARVSDAVFGVLIMLLVINYSSPNDLFDGLTRFQEFIVITLENTVKWLMGSPAGFKLNYPLNNVLGPFYQFHIALWGTFLRLCNPILRIIFHILLFLGSFGFSFQVAIAADILAVVSVHMYCIYVYASRIHFLQIEGLKILSRLFIGKKRKPLPGKTQALPYTTEQLLFGTVSFTILLFLLPTTLIYYFVFTTIRIVLIFIGGLLTRLRHIMSVFPVYIIWLWIFDPLRLTSTVRLSTNTICWRDGTLVTKIRPVCKSWSKTVSICIPENLNRPKDIKWRKLTTSVLLGNLIYPV